MTVAQRTARRKAGQEGDQGPAQGRTADRTRGQRGSGRRRRRRGQRQPGSGRRWATGGWWAREVERWGQWATSSLSRRRAADVVEESSSAVAFASEDGQRRRGPTSVARQAVSVRTGQAGQGRQSTGKRQGRARGEGRRPRLEREGQGGLRETSAASAPLARRRAVSLAGQEMGSCMSFLPKWCGVR